jgi:MFS family permease
MAIVAGCLAVLVTGANLATPLYAVYADRYGFSSAVLAAIFAIYALVLIPSLLAFGQLSDRLGRRRVIAAGLGVGIVGLILFAVASGTAWLFIARAVQGLSVGMITAAAAAALVELDPDHDRRRGALLATLATSGGSAAGPIIGGIVAQWGPLERVLPYLVGIALLLGAGAALLAVPESTATHSGGGWHFQRPRVPAEIRTEFMPVALTGAAVWAVAGLFLSVIPSYASDLLGTSNLAALGAITAIVLVCSCATQVTVRRGALHPQALADGLGLLAVGLLALVPADPLTVALLFVGAGLAGAGHGLGFLSAQDQLNRIAPDDRRAEINAALYTCIYLGVALPVIGTGIIASATTLFVGIAVFSGVTGVSVLLVAARQLGHRGGAPGASPPQGAAHSSARPGRSPHGRLTALSPNSEMTP